MSNPINSTDSLGLITWEDIQAYGKCVVDCVKKCPDSIAFQDRMKGCKELNVNGMEFCFGIPHPQGRAACVGIVKGINMGCRAWAASVLADDLYRCKKQCDKEKDCDNDR